MQRDDGGKPIDVLTLVCRPRCVHAFMQRDEGGKPIDVLTLMAHAGIVISVRGPQLGFDLEVGGGRSTVHTFFSVVNIFVLGINAPPWDLLHLHPSSTLRLLLLG